MQKLLWIIFCGITLHGLAQKDSIPLAPYLKTRQIPSFKILQMDSATYFYKNQLKKNTPTVIIYFNPDCEHCKTETQHLIDSMELVKNAQFVFVSYAIFKEIKKFDSVYQFKNYENIKIGRDEKYYVPVYYKVRFTPFVAVYDKKGYLLRAFEGGTTIKKLAALVK